MKWEKGFTARYTCTIVDPHTWRDIGQVNIVSGDISNSAESLRTSASLDTKEYLGEQWIRLYLEARQEGEASERVPLFTGLTSSPEKDMEGLRETYSVDCYSVLKPAEDILLQRGYYAPAGASGADLAKKLISVGGVIVTLEEGSPKLSEAIVAEDGESRLSMADKIITAIGWRLRVNGDGSVHIEPSSSEAVARFDPNDQDSIEPKVTEKYDWFVCPNVFRAVSGDTVAIARDDNPDSSLSTVSRGREIWMEDTSVTLNDGESLAAYASRRLKEEQSPSKTISYSRRFNPDLHVGDVIRMNYKNLSGTYRVTSQKITLGAGGKTSEEAEICL